MYIKSRSEIYNLLRETYEPPIKEDVLLRLSESSTGHPELDDELASINDGLKAETSNDAFMDDVNKEYHRLFQKRTILPGSLAVYDELNRPGCVAQTSLIMQCIYVGWAYQQKHRSTGSIGAYLLSHLEFIAFLAQSARIDKMTYRQFSYLAASRDFLSKCLIPWMELIFDVVSLECKHQLLPATVQFTSAFIKMDDQELEPMLDGWWQSY